MAAVDALLRTLIQQEGDELKLTQDQAPAMFRRGERLRVFFPAFNDELKQQLVGDLLTPDRLARLADGEPVQMTYNSEDLGSFAVKIRGPGGRSLHFKRGADVTSPEPAPVVELPLPFQNQPSPTAPRPADGQIDPLLGALLEEAMAARASDLHFAHGELPVIRVDGALRALHEHGPIDTEALLARFLEPHILERLDAGGSADLALAHGGNRLRINLYRCEQGLAAAFRVLRRRAPSIQSLRLPVDLDSIAQLSHGLVILCGPTGSGKSTTLAALAQEILNRRGGMLITLEDPIEYNFNAENPSSLVRQREVGQHVTDFRSGLRDALREDPDILLVGEMRDTESISLALTAAETGHLVLASLHSRSSSSAIERIVDVYAPERQHQIRVQIADCLQAIISQRLLPRASGSGRVAAVEILRNTHRVSALIRDGKTAQLVSAIQSGAGDDMVPLERCLRDLVRSGQITSETAQNAANDPATLKGYTP